MHIIKEVLDNAADEALAGFGKRITVALQTDGSVTIEDDVLVASGVSIMNGCRQHGISSLDQPIREQSGIYEEITIGSGTWIGEKATVAASIGKHCVVGAGSLVLKPVPDYAIVVAVPARVIGDRRERNVITESPSVSGSCHRVDDFRVDECLTEVCANCP